MMKKFFQYFGLNQMEQNGFLVLSVLIVLVLFVPYLFKLHKDTKPQSYELVYFEESSDPTEHPMLESNASLLDATSYPKKGKSLNNMVLFDFDPNGLDELSWSKLGFSKNQIRVIKNYEAKGGKFYKKEDVAKIYVISTKEYRRIEPYIRIDNLQFRKETTFKHGSSQNERPEAVAPKVKPLAINTADTSAWKSLPGIGTVLANRIVKYRNALGGFYAVEQLQEVYGLPIETYERIKENIDLDIVAITHLQINIFSEEELAKHPYINKKQAQAIVRYRQQHGRFVDFESLSKIQSFDRDFLRKIEPYLHY